MYVHSSLLTIYNKTEEKDTVGIIVLCMNNTEQVYLLVIDSTPIPCINKGNDVIM